jgi:hypothetical protein
VITEVAIFANDHAIADMAGRPDARPRANHGTGINQGLRMKRHKTNQKSGNQKQKWAIML